MVTTFNPLWLDQGWGRERVGINWKENWRDFFGLIILQTFDILLFASCVCIFAEVGRKICKIDQCGSASIFSHFAICCAFSWGLNLGRILVVCGGGGPFHANGIFKILHNPDWWQHLWVFFCLVWINFYHGLFMGSQKCKFLFPLTARWAVG